MTMARIKLRALEECLQELEGFESPKVKLEQYVTRPHIAARMLHMIETNFGDLDGKLVADLGCGCGVLAVGAGILGAQHVVGFEIDPAALRTFNENIQEMELNTIDSVLCDVTNSLPGNLSGRFDCVVMNPPFGTNRKGTDIEFLQVALSLTRGSVYSLHKTSTREHVLKKAKQFGVNAQVLAELRYDLPATYKFHKKASVDIEVDFIRFSHFT